VIIATEAGKVVGFCAVECTRRGFLGPMGTHPANRGTGICRALLLAGLSSMREQGYVYAIIGGAGPVDFYAKCCGATVIPDSKPGIYVDPLR
jgi:predicted N-acetyltransferase YhbS